MALALRALSALVLAGAVIVFPASAATAEPAEPQWPTAQGDYTTALDPGWMYFLPAGFDGRGCGIGPDGTVGCDIVPGRWPDGTPIQIGIPGPPGSYSCEGRRCPLPPPGTDQTVASPSEPGEYVASDTATFTRDVDVLPAGYQLVNGGASCHVGYQGTVTCVTGANGFTLASVFGILEAP